MEATLPDPDEFEGTIGGDSAEAWAEASVAMTPEFMDVEDWGEDDGRSP